MQERSDRIECFMYFAENAMIRITIVAVLSAVLGLAAPVQAEAPKKLLLLYQSPDGHPPQTHEYEAGLKLVAKLLKPAPNLEVLLVRADSPWKVGPDLLERADGAVLFLAEGARWMQSEPEVMKSFAKLAKRGGALVVLHWAMGAKDAKYIDGALQLLGCCHGGPDRKYKVLTTDAKPAAAHPVTAGIGSFRAHDEFYYGLKTVATGKGHPPQPLLTVSIDGKDETVAWTWERPDGGRSFGFSGLHFHDNWKLPEYRRLVLQGIRWSMKLPIPKDGIGVDVDPADLKLK